MTASSRVRRHSPWQKLARVLGGRSRSGREPCSIARPTRSGPISRQGRHGNVTRAVLARLRIKAAASHAQLLRRVSRPTSLPRPSLYDLPAAVGAFDCQRTHIRTRAPFASVSSPCVSKPSASALVRCLVCLREINIAASTDSELRSSHIARYLAVYRLSHLGTRFAGSRVAWRCPSEGRTGSLAAVGSPMAVGDVPRRAPITCHELIVPVAMPSVPSHKTALSRRKPS